MVNETMVLRHLRMKMGLSHNISPLTDDQMLEVVKLTTLPVFSTYYPYQFFSNVYESTDQWEKTKGIYILDSKEIPILGVSRIFRSSQYLYDKYPIYNVDAFNYQMFSDLKSITTIPQTFLFYPPNRLEVYPKFYTPSDFMVELKCQHPDHFTTIPLALREQFFNLALYDVRDAVWQIIKNIANLNTAFGQININTDEFQSAVSDRTTLLEKWDTEYIREPNRKKIFIA